MKKSLTKTRLSKKSLRNKADELCRKIVQKYGKCERCGFEFEGRGLHWAHFISRGVQKLRWNPKNWAALCAGCHKYLDLRPSLKTRWWQEKRGAKTVEWLERESYKLKPLAPEWYQNIVGDLEKVLEQL